MSGLWRLLFGRGAASSVLAATLIAAAVWVLAESQTLREAELELSVIFSTGGSGRILRVAPGSEWGGRVVVNVEGGAAAIDDLRERSKRDVTLTLGAELPAEPGARLIDLRAAVAGSELFRDSGVAIRSAAPESVTLEVDVVEQRTLPLVADVGALEVQGETAVEPAQVTVTLPASFVGLLPPVAEARVDPSRVAELRLGQRATLRQTPVVLRGLPERVWGVRIEPARAAVELQLRARVETFQLPPVPVELLIAPALLSSWAVEIPPEDRELSGVLLVGGAEGVAQVRAGERVVRAVVPLSAADLESGVTEKVPELLGVPPTVIATNANTPVRVRIARRNPDGSVRPIEPAGQPEQPGGE